MPKRKRNRSSSTAPTAPPGAGASVPPVESAPVVDPAVAMFAERHRAQQEAERRSREAERVARRQAEERAALLRTKDEAAARLKAVRRQEIIAPGEVETAEAAYTAAAADLVEAETGERPSWAPARPEPEAEPEAVPIADEQVPDSTEDGPVQPAPADQEPEPPT